MTTLYELPIEKHDSLICGEIGAVVAHDYRSRPGFVVLTIRDGGPPAAVIDAIAATHPKAVPPVPRPEREAAKAINPSLPTPAALLAYLREKFAEDFA